MHQLQGNKEYGSEKKGYLLKKSDGYVHPLLVPWVLSSLPKRQVRLPTGFARLPRGKDTYSESQVSLLLEEAVTVRCLCVAPETCDAQC